MSSQPPRRVVFKPDIVLAALFDPNARNLLNEWRDGKVIAVLNRELLLCYLKVLREVGLGPELIRKWVLWFTLPGKALYLDALYMDGNASGEQVAHRVCEAIAAETNSQAMGYRDCATKS